MDGWINGLLAATLYVDTRFSEADVGLIGLDSFGCGAIGRMGLIGLMGLGEHVG